MIKAAIVAGIALLAAGAAGAQTVPVSAPPASAPVTTSSSERVRDAAASQYFLIKTVVGQSIDMVDARAQSVEPEGYNLLRYCWTPANVLGDWAENAGLTGVMVTRALETHSWSRDLARAGYPQALVAEAIGHFEASLVASGFTDVARGRALEALVGTLDVARRTTPGAAKILTVDRCGKQIRPIVLNFKTAPEGGRIRFIPNVLHQLCQAQQLNPDDPVRCDYWINAKPEGPMSFAGQMAYSVRWPDGTVSTGTFDTVDARDTGIVTLRERPVKK